MPYETCQWQHNHSNYFPSAQPVITVHQHCLISMIASSDRIYLDCTYTLQFTEMGPLKQNQSIYRYKIKDVKLPMIDL